MSNKIEQQQRQALMTPSQTTTTTSTKLNASHLRTQSSSSSSSSSSSNTTTTNNNNHGKAPEVGWGWNQTFLKPHLRPERCHPACLQPSSSSSSASALLPAPCHHFVYQANRTHPAAIEQLDLPDGIYFQDGIHVQVLRPDQFQEVKAVFIAIWLQENILYRTLRVHKDEFEEYVDILLDRALLFPLSAVVAMDVTLKHPKIIGVLFIRDLWGDVIDTARYGLLSQKIQTILALNRDALMPFQVNPVFRHLREPGKVMYALHAGMSPGYATREYDAGAFGTLNIISRLHAFQAEAMWARGYKGIIGVATHQDVVKRTEARHMLNPYDVIVSRIEYKTWSTKRYAEGRNGLRITHESKRQDKFRKLAVSETQQQRRKHRRTGKHHQRLSRGNDEEEADESGENRPFRQIHGVPYCVCIYESFPTISPSNAAKEGKTTTRRAKL